MKIHRKQFSSYFVIRSYQGGFDLRNFSVSAPVLRHILSCCDLKSEKLLGWKEMPGLFRDIWLGLKDIELRVIVLFTVRLLPILVSSKHDWLSPEWWFYRTRESCFSQLQEVILSSFF